MSNKEKELLEKMFSKWDENHFDERKLLAFMRLIRPLAEEYKKEKTSLLENELVQRYFIVDSLSEEYNSVLEDLEEKYEEIVQADCQHNLWYLLHSESDDYEGRTYWVCACLDCGLVKEERSHNFNNVIKGYCLFARAERHEKSFETIQQEYRILLDKYDNYYEKKGLDEVLYNETVVQKVFVKKYK